MSVGTILALLLLASVVVRILGGTGAAIAREVAALAPDAGRATASEIAQCEDSAEIERLLANLRSRDAALEAREAAADRRTADLNEASALIAEQMEDLVRAEEELAATIATAAAAAETDIAQLTSVYENMKPKQAAAVFEEMAPEFAAGFLSRMRSDAAAQILAGIDPASAYSISVILAGRNADVPTE